MTGNSFTVEAFADQGARQSALDEVAGIVTSAASTDDPDTMLVVALRPVSDRRRVVASAGNTAIRAAVSVAIAASNYRAWVNVTGDGIVDVPINALPEIIRAAIEPCGIRSVRVGGAADGDTYACLTMWLSRSEFVSADREALQVDALRRLREAVELDHRRASEAVDSVAVARATPIASDLDDLDLPDLDPLEDLPERTDFEQALAALRSDEAGLIVLGIDELDSFATSVGIETPGLVLREFAQRLLAACRKADVIARVDDSTFAVLLVDVDRKTAFEVSKRIRSRVSEPIPHADGVIELSISVGLAHESGLFEPAELFESAESAMSDARQAGGARMLVAS